jgi:hypothetical protein
LRSLRPHSDVDNPTGDSRWLRQPATTPMKT